MMYEVYLKVARGIFPVEADTYKQKDDHTVFYLGTEEVARFLTKNISKVKLPPLVYPKI